MTSPSRTLPPAGTPARGEGPGSLPAVAAPRGNRPRIVLLAVTAVGVVVVAVISVMVGAYVIPVGDVFAVLAAKAGLSDGSGTLNEAVVWDLRLTRVLLAGAVGAALACSGAAYQGTFRNPLVEPFILGVSAGAAFGAGLSVMVDLPLSLQVMAFVFGMLAVWLTYSLSRVRGERPTVTLILAGVVVGSFFSALFSLFQYVGTDEQLRRLVFWIMGGFYRATWGDVAVVLPATLVGCALLWRAGWGLNILSLGDDEARSLGVDPEPLRRKVIVLATALTALAVSVSGIIAWVGLLIPHAARLLVGPDHRFVVPLSATLGAVFVMVCDVLARTIHSGEVPISIITSILGAPYLVYLLRTRSTFLGAQS
ncbi:iron complex transport system permease protein [Micromonospora nigra]|uniref:Iron complex transport system permease protein n=1 Tax=Micromonospora nigra TaxID=145857 RepID=A0A1C6R9A4_9ACTN|nr:iron ABC transporter permease [Micromonospora nigra]SCL13536.1 iron complex transport system permease protein [Micromonospora nigra]